MPDSSSITDDWFVSARRAVLVVDMAESVRMIEADEVGTITRWRELVAYTEQALIPRHGGRKVKSLGDGMLLEMPNVHGAVGVAFGIRSFLEDLNKDLEAAKKMQVRIGIEVGDLMVDKHDVYGHSVNLAARLTGIGDPGDVTVSAAVRDELVDGVDAVVEDLGDCFLKHIRKPVRAYRIMPPGSGPRMRVTSSVKPLLPTLAVIPFRDLSRSTESAVGQIVAEELIRAFGQSPHLNVISRLSTAAFARSDHSLAEVAELLDASHIITGSVSEDNGSIRVSVDLTEVRTGQLIWSDRFSDSAASILLGDQDMIVQIAQNVGRAIINRELQRARSLPVRTLESYTLLLAGIHGMYRLSRSDFQRSQTILDAVVERNPRHSVPMAWLGHWHVLKVQQGWASDPKTERDAAQSRTARALDVNPDCEHALTINGLVQTMLGKDFDVAEDSFARALDTNPNNPLSNIYKGLMHAFRDEGDVAVEFTRRALAGSPFDPQRYLYDCLAAVSFISAGKPEDALFYAERSLKANATHTSTLRTLAIAQWQVGQKRAAKSTVQKLTSLEPEFTVSKWRMSNPAAEYKTGRMIARILREAGAPE